MGEVAAAGGQHAAVGPEAAALRHHGHVAQRVAEPLLLLQAPQHMGGVDRRLEGKHRQPGGSHGRQRHLHTHTRARACTVNP